MKNSKFVKRKGAYRMKRSLSVICLFIFIFGPALDAKQRARSHTKAKAKAAYCPGVKVITDCADEGCGPHSDPELNKRKNIRSDNQQPVGRTIVWMKSLPDPANFTEENKDRSELRQLGEGQKITVVAWLLDIRQEHQETCNCGLDNEADTDNHLVLVDPAATKNPTLKRYEPHSITAEFTPRVRLDHSRFTREAVMPLLHSKAERGKKKEAPKLLVRVTGILMFDSHHFLNNPLVRENNWEIHPILKFEYCPEGPTCRPDSGENWKDLESE
jgi:hypothetical protein